MYLLKGNNGLEDLSCYICIGNVAMYFFKNFFILVQNLCTVACCL